MLIRLAKPDDASQIHAIVKSLYINRSNFELRYGFIVYYLNEEEYKKRISNNTFYVAVVDENVVGYLMAYNNTTLKSYLEKGIITHEDKIIENIFNYCKLHSIHEFIFIDQMAVSIEFQKKCYGGLLLKKFCQDTKGPYFGAILNEPICNPNERFFTKRGMKRVCEVEVEAKNRWQILNGKGNPLKLKWGIYMADKFGFRFSEPKRMTYAIHNA